MTPPSDALIAWVKEQEEHHRCEVSILRNWASIAIYVDRIKAYEATAARHQEAADHFAALHALLVQDNAPINKTASEVMPMTNQKSAAVPCDVPRYVRERLAELREWRHHEPRGYTRSAYDAQIEELERLQDEAGWSDTDAPLPTPPPEAP